MSSGELTHHIAEDGVATRKQFLGDEATTNKVRLPKQWNISALDKVAAVQTGIAKGKTVNGSGVTLPYLRVANVQDGHVDLTMVKEITVGQSDVPRYCLRDGDVLFTEGGDFDKLGRGSVWHGEISPCLHQNHIFAVRTDREVLLPEFLAFQAASRYGRRYFQLSSKQSTNLASINSTQLKSFPVLVAPIQEQRRIVAILRTWDEAIENVESLVEMRAAQYATDSRHFFAPCHPTFKPRGNDWKPFNLGKLFNERIESGLDSDALLSITMADGVISQDEVGRRDSSCEDKSKYKLILPGDIGYNTMRMWQGVCGLSSLRGIVSPAYTIVTPIESTIDARYAFHLFKSRRMIHDFERYSQGLTSDTWNLKYPAFSEIKVFIPHLTVQIAQAKYLDAMKEEIGMLKRQVEALSRQKRGLMQKLLTGEWRVKC